MHDVFCLLARVQDWRHEQKIKERAHFRSLCHSEERSDVGIRSPQCRTETYCRPEKERIATTSLRTGLAMTEGVCTLPSLFPIGNFCTPATPQTVLRPPAPLRGASRGCQAAHFTRGTARKSSPVTRTVTPPALTSNIRALKSSADSSGTYARIVTAAP